MKIEKSPELAEVILSYKTKVKASDRPQLRSSRDVYELLKKIYNDDTVEHHEEFVIILLNRGNRVLGWGKVSQGGISSTDADRRIMFQFALLANATSMMLSHNHPSGQIIPSEQDRLLTKKIFDLAKIHDIALLEHIIYTRDSYYSFADEADL